MPKKRDLRHELEEDFQDDEYYDEIQTRRDDQKQMLACVSDGNLVQLRKLISRGVNPDFWNKFDMTPLHIAASNLNTEAGKELVELLVYYGAMLDRRDRFGQVPLHIASGLSSDGVFILLEAGSQVNSQDNAGRTPLMLACHGEYSPQALTIVQYLLDRGAKVGVKDGDGQTALHYVTSNTKMDLAVKNEIVYKLLYAGISADTEDNRGKTALLNELNFFIFNPDGMVADNNNVNEDSVTLIHRRLSVYKLLIRAGAQLLTRMSHEQSGRYILDQLNQRSNLCTILLNLALPVLPLHNRKLYLHAVREELKNLRFNVDSRGEFMHTLKTSVENASSLKSTCRNTVRERLGSKIFFNAGKLGLPKELENYVTYAECM